MLFRLIVLAIALGLGVMMLRKWSRRLAASGVSDLDAGELADVKALAARAKSIAKALEIREKVTEILLDDRNRGAEGGGEIGVQIDRAIRELARQHRTLERITAAVGAIDLDALADAERKADDALAATVDPDARAEVRKTAERVALQRQQIEQLGRRRRELEAGGAQILLDLQNLHLALLDAASSRAGIAAEPVRALREKLAEATRDVAASAHAEEEIEKALRAEATRT